MKTKMLHKRFRPEFILLSLMIILLLIVLVSSRFWDYRTTLATSPVVDESFVEQEIIDYEGGRIVLLENEETYSTVILQKKLMYWDLSVSMTTPKLNTAIETCCFISDSFSGAITGDDGMSVFSVYVRDENIKRLEAGPGSLRKSVTIDGEGFYYLQWEHAIMWFDLHAAALDFSGNALYEYTTYWYDPNTLYWIEKT